MFQNKNFRTYLNRKQNNRLVSDGNNSEKYSLCNEECMLNSVFIHFFKLTRKKLDTSISDLVNDAFFVPRELIVVMSSLQRIYQK